MYTTTDKPYIDPYNIVEREINGCKVRLLFILEPNQNVKQHMLDHLMVVFDRKMQASASV